MCQEGVSVCLCVRARKRERYGKDETNGEIKREGRLNFNLFIVIPRGLRVKRKER